MSKSTNKRSGGGRRKVPSTASRFQRTRSDHAKELAEDYVELIDDLIRDTGEARAVDIAEYLGVTHVTVNNTLRRLKRDGLVKSEPYRSIFLTPAGKRLADKVRKRHLIVLEFLRAIGVPARDAENDAEGIEHHLSPKTLDAMKRFVDGKR